MSDQGLQLQSTPAIQLIPVPPEGGQMSASIPIRWCISQEIIARLSEVEAYKPYLLVVVINDSHEMSRQIFSLQEGQRYVRFFAPGKNIVRATIVWDSYAPVSDLLKRGSGGFYRTDVIETTLPPLFYEHREVIDKLERKIRGGQEEAEQLRLRDELELLVRELTEIRENQSETGLCSRFDSSLMRLPDEAVLEVEVDPNHFGAVRDNWWLTRQLAGIFKYETAPVDPCHVRKRALFALCSLPLLAVLACTIGLAALIIVELFNLLVVSGLVVLGMRGISCEALRHPWNTNPSMAWRDLRTSIWTAKEVTDKNGNTQVQQRPFLVKTLSPPVLVGLIGAAYLLKDHHGWIAVLGKLAIVLYISFVVYVTIHSCVALYQVSTAQRRTNRRNVAELIETDAAYRRSEALVRELGPVSCAVAGPSGHAPRATFALRFEGLKATVCQPFARKPN